MTLSLDDAYRLAKLAAERRLYHAKDFFEPYGKQLEFFAAGAQGGAGEVERLFSAGNQLGKTIAGGFETACHVTGSYPKWWTGRVFNEPVNFWVSGKTTKDTRDGIQTMLCGPPGNEELWGSGMIPRAAFAGKPKLQHGTADAYDFYNVKWRDRSGRLDESAISRITQKAYDQGRESHQSATLHGIWGDEEPPADIYGEWLPRIAKHKGFIFVTFTPLKGASEVVRRYMYETAPGRCVTMMGIYEVGHYTREEADGILARYLENERMARGFGVPMQGEGAVFTTSRADLAIQPPQGGIRNVPLHWTKLWGLDFGIGHPFGAVLTAWDRDFDCFYVCHCIKMANASKLQHIPAIRAVASEVPVAWPHDMTQRREAHDGELSKIADQYRNPGPGQLGLNMLSQHATFPEGGYPFSAGIDEMSDRMQTGRFKVFDTPENGEWFNEYGNYHREKGLVVKVFDDLLSATRVALMDKRKGRSLPLGSSIAIARATRPTRSAPIDPFSGRPLTPY